MREFVGVISAKALAMATIALAVVNSGLSPFDQALIIALSSACVTGVFTLAAAWIAVKFAARPIHEEVKAAHEQAESNMAKLQEVQDKLDE